MSNALAIASVTRALLDLLNDGLINNDVAHAVGHPVVVTALPPDRVLGGAANNRDPTQLNIYLYHVTFNAGWRQADLPTRDVRGELSSLPLLALNLHYLLTAYGSEDLQSEILLGYAMQLLHENPVLGRTELRRTLTAAAVGPGILPAAYDTLRASDLADQIELVKLTPESMSTDEMSKLWTAQQTHYRASAAYQASVVLIESRRPTRTPMPVLTRGPRDPVSGRERGVTVTPGLLPVVPTIDTLSPPNQQPVVRLGEALRIDGYHLDSGQVTALFTDPRTQLALELPTTGAETSRTAQLPAGAGLGGATPILGTDPDNWRAGIYNVSLRLKTGLDPERPTNSVPCVVAPRIVSIAAATAGGETTFTVHCSPRLRDTQAISLVVGTRELRAEPLAAQATDTAQFKGNGFVIGSTPWVRLRVDGIDSLLINRSTTPPSFFASEKVVIA